MALAPDADVTCDPSLTALIAILDAGPDETLYSDLIRLADARAARADDPSAILELRERLLQAEVQTFEEPLQRFVGRLVRLSPEGAERVLELALQLVAYHHEAEG